jgi:hypothetical protein
MESWTQRIAKILKLTLHEMSLRRQRLPAAGLNLGTEPVQRWFGGGWSDLRGRYVGGLGDRAWTEAAAMICDG